MGGEALGRKREMKREEQLSSLRAVAPLSASHAFLLLCHGLFIVLDRAHRSAEYSCAGERSRGCLWGWACGCVCAGSRARLPPGCQLSSPVLKNRRQHSFPPPVVTAVIT